MGRVGRVKTTFVTSDEFPAPFESVMGVIAVAGDVISVWLEEDAVRVIRSAATPIVMELETTCPSKLEPTNK